MAGPAGPRPASSASGGGSAAAPITVAQLAGLIDRTLRSGLPGRVAVVGEIGQCRQRTHWYFDLKDESCCVSCVMWASAARRSGANAEDGAALAQGRRVVCTGRVEFYPPQGKTQFIVEKVEPVGVGALDAAFRRLCAELRELGWFDESRKRPLPMLPGRIAVVTSRSGAALQDVIDTVSRRCPCVQLCLVDVRVQGPGAAEQVARAVAALGRSRGALGIDAVLVTRGGGSLEDLWAFNERIVAEAIVACPIPVVAAIGHETDTTIAELVADLRGATPTQAAMRLVPDAADLRRQLGSLGARMAAGLTRRVRLEAERLRSASRHPALSDPGRIVADRAGVLSVRAHALRHAVLDAIHARSARLAALERRLESQRPSEVYARRRAALASTEARLRTAVHDALCRHDADALARRLAHAAALGLRPRRARVEALERSLSLVSPLRVLERGYSVTLDASGRAVRSASQARPGDALTTLLSDGRVESVVGGVTPGGGATPLPPLPPLTPSPPPGSTTTRRNPRPRQGPANTDAAPPPPPPPGLFG